MGETVLRCVCVEREDSATQRLRGVTAPLEEQDHPANKVYISVDSSVIYLLLYYLLLFELAVIFIFSF